MSTKADRRPEPVSGTIGWDDLWIAVKCQSNLEIAGSPRKIYGDRLLEKCLWGRALNGASRVTELSQPNSEYTSKNTRESAAEG